MGTWGIRIYEDDSALDVRADYLDQLKDGVEANIAERQVLADHTTDHKGDRYSNDLVILALCCAQLESGTLSKTITDKALDIISSGRDIDFWLKEGGKEDATARKRELTLIRKYIADYAGQPIRRKSWVELQRADKDYEAQQARETQTGKTTSSLDQTAWPAFIQAFFISTGITLVVGIPLFFVLLERMQHKPISFVWFAGVSLFFWSFILIRLWWHSLFEETRN